MDDESCIVWLTRLYNNLNDEYKAKHEGATALSESNSTDSVHARTKILENVLKKLSESADDLEISDYKEIIQSSCMWQNDLQAYTRDGQPLRYVKIRNILSKFLGAQLPTHNELQNEPKKQEIASAAPVDTVVVNTTPDVSVPMNAPLTLITPKNAYNVMV